VAKALEHALARARAAGKFIAVYAASGERAAVLVKQGFDLVAIGSDINFLRAGAQAVLAAARS
jgi:4-hydroxy-2-oxoheptanedioate aldolase